MTVYSIPERGHAVQPQRPLPIVVVETVTPRSSDVKRKFLIVVVLLLCVVGVLAISHYFLIDGSLQLDEAQSLWQTSHSIGGTLHAVALDVHVPLYHLLLHFWQLYLGQSITTARILSVIFFVMTIPLFYMLARQILSTNWSLFAVVLFSFSPFMNWYANVARMYSMLAFFATLSQLLFMQLMKRRKVWLGFGISAVTGAYAHYFFSFNLVTEGLFFLFRRKEFAKGSLKRMVAVTLSVALAIAPWIYYFHKLGLADNTRPILERPSAVDFFNVYSQFLFGFQDNHVNTVLISCWPIVMLIGFLAVQRNQRLTPQVSFMATMAVVPVAMAFILSYLITPFFLSRYLISSVGPLLIFLVWLLSYYGKRLARVIAAVSLIGLLLTFMQQIRSPSTPVKENYRQATAYINQHIEPQDIVVLSSPFTIYPFEYYYTGQAAIATLPIWQRSGNSAIPAFNTKTFPSQVAKLNFNHHDVYLLLSYDQGYEAVIKQYYLDHFKQVYSHTYSNDLTLYEYQIGYYNVPVLGTKGAQITAANP
jgi:mannosyltransferase